MFKGKEEEFYHGHMGSVVSVSPADEGTKSGEGVQENNSDGLGEQG